MPYLRTPCVGIGCAALLMATLTGAAAPAAQPSALELMLQPQTDANERIDGLDVMLRLSVAEAGPDDPLVQMPLVSSNVETTANRIERLAASDARGPLTLALRHEGPEGEGTNFWFPDRAVEGAVTIRYRVAIDDRLAARGAAPPLELRREAGAFSGAGSVFLLLPDEESPVRLAVRWDLAALGPGAAGFSSLGRGDVALDNAQPPAGLGRSFFMAGAIGHYPEGRDNGFFAAWQGTPPFDARETMAWTGRLYDRYAEFFHEAAPAYGVFLRRNLVNPGGGVAMNGSFVATYGEETDPADLKLTLAHEMFHTFAPSIDDPDGLESSWFGEGLAVFYQRVLPLRFGQISIAEFLDDLNYHAARYYTNALGDRPNSEVPRRFWADTRIRTLPYDRGSLYFAMVNDQMRKASHGERSLDDLMLAMVERQRTGRKLSNADWEELLRTHLGEQAVADFRAFLAGRPPLPASDAFGPCFRRTTRPLRRYVLGFDPEVLIERRRIVRGLIPGSAAEAAGLRNGDEIVRPVPQDAIQGDQTRQLVLLIRRDGREFELSYLPRGETVDAYQWERVENVPDSACAI